MSPLGFFFTNSIFEFPSYRSTTPTSLFLFLWLVNPLEFRGQDRESSLYSLGLMEVEKWSFTYLLRGLRESPYRVPAERSVKEAEDVRRHGGSLAARWYCSCWCSRSYCLLYSSGSRFSSSNPPPFAILPLVNSLWLNRLLTKLIFNITNEFDKIYTSYIQIYLILNCSGRCCKMWIQ